MDAFGQGSCVALGTMKPDFALDLSHDGIGLLHRSGGGWALVGEVKLDDPAMGAKLNALRDAAQALAGGDFTTKLVLPNSQILYTTLEAPGPDDIAREVQIRGALEGLTPYSVGELVFDWRAEGDQARVSVLARETMAEAETFAADFGFNPVSFVARPDSGVFSGEPFFGKTTLAAKLLGPGTRVLPEASPVPAHPKPLDAAVVPPTEDAAAPLAPGLPPVPSALSEPELEAPKPKAIPEPSTPPPALPPEIPGGASDLTPAVPAAAAEPDQPPAPRAPSDDLLSPFPPTPDEDGNLPPPPPRKVSRVEDSPKPAPKPPKPAPEKPADEAPPASFEKAEPPQPVKTPPEARTTTHFSPLSPTLPPDEDTSPTQDTPPAPDAKTPPPADDVDQVPTPAKPRFVPVDGPSPAAPDTRPDEPDTTPAPSFASRRRAEPVSPAEDKTEDKTPAPAPKPGLSASIEAAPNAAPRLSVPNTGIESKAPAAKNDLRAENAAPTPRPSRAPLGSAERTRLGMAEALQKPLPSPQKSAETDAPGRGAQLASTATALGGAMLAKAGTASKDISSRAKAALQRSAPDKPQEAATTSTDEQSGKPSFFARGSALLAKLRKDDSEEAAETPPSAWATAPLPTAAAPSQDGEAPLQDGEASDVKPDDTRAETPAAPAPLKGPSTPAPDAPGDTAPLKTSPLNRFKRNPPPAPDPETESRSKEADSLTVFGARKNEEIGGKPPYLGLALTLVLLLLMAIVALWSTLFGTEEQALFNPDPSSPTVSAPADPARPETPSAASQDPGAAPATAETPQAESQTPPSQDLDPGTVLSEEAAAARYAATGVWQRAPEALGTPETDSLETLEIARVDPDVAAVDQVTLPTVTTPQTPATAAAPPPADTSFDLTDDGLVVATSNGALSPEGILVFAGRPPIVPPLRPAALTPEPSAPTPSSGDPDAPAADTPVPSVDPRIPNITPRARPAGLVAEDQAAVLPPAAPALTRNRPRARPSGLVTTAAVQPAQGTPTETPDIAPEAIEAAVESVIEEANPFASATRLAAARSPKPNARPRNIARLVEQARAAEARAAANASASASQARNNNSDGSQVIAASAATTRPKIPSAASVARTATQKNVLNLSRVNLIGIYGSASSRRALVRLSNGRYIKVKVGDRLDGGRVTSLSTSRLTYQKGNRTVTLDAPPLG